MPKFDALIHLASHSANYPYDNLENCLYQNLTVPLRMLNLAFEAGIDKFLITGSCFEYGLSGINFDKIPANALILLNLSCFQGSSINCIHSICKRKKNWTISLRLFRFMEKENYIQDYTLSEEIGT